MKTKLFSFLLILCLLLAGCASGTDNSSTVVPKNNDSQPTSDNTQSADTSNPNSSSPDEKPSWDTTPRKIEYVGHPFSGYLNNVSTYYSGVESDVPTVLIKSTADLNSFLKIYSPYGYSSDKSFGEFAAALDDAYFNEKALVVSFCTSGTGSTVFNFEGVRIDENGITVTISDKTPEVGTCDMQYRLMTVEVNKADIGNCNLVRTEIEHRTYPLSGKIGEYDPTPRDISFTPYTFNYIIENRVISTENGNPVLKLNVSSDEYALSYVGNLIEYGKSGDNLDKYLNKGYSYFKDKALLFTYVASNNGKSIFEISSVRADENGITMTVSHRLGAEAETDSVYSILVAEIDVALLAGCEIFNIKFENTENSLSPPYVFPDPFSENPYNDINVDNRTPEGYGTTITQEPNFIGSVYRPVYFQLHDGKQAINEGGIELLLYDASGNFVQRSFTNSNGVARFVVKSQTSYEIRFTGNDVFYPCNYNDFGGANYCMPQSQNKLFGYSSRTYTPDVEQRLYYLLRKSDYAYKQTQINLKFVDKATGKPIENVRISYNDALCSDKDGNLSALALTPSYYTAYAAGYLDTPMLIRENTKALVIEMESITPAPTECVDITITVTDKSTGKGIKGATANIELIGGISEAPYGNPSDENGVITMSVSKATFDKFPTVKVYAEGYLVYCSFKLEEGVYKYNLQFDYLYAERITE